MLFTFSDDILPSIIKKITKFLSSRTEFVVVISVYKNYPAPHRGNHKINREKKIHVNRES